MDSELEHIIGRGPVHFIGIGGISMSGLAQILLYRGIAVTGSDWHESGVLDHLRSLGAIIRVPHFANSITGQTLVVHTAAIPSDNPELVEARRLGIPIMDRAHFLGDLAAGYKNTLAVSGTHGKTTSTGMVATVMMTANLDPTIHIGGMLASIGGNTRLGGRDLFVMEACEYKNSFLQFHPTHALILNIEADHLDFFRNLDDILDSFTKYTYNIPLSGTLVLNLDDDGCRQLASRIDRPYTGFQLSVPDLSDAGIGRIAGMIYHVSNLTYKHGYARFDACLAGKRLARIHLAVPGRHNASNALGCFALCHRMGLSPDLIAAGLAGFSGTGRRFERRGSVGGVDVIDDYAHHPTEIAATLDTAAQMTKGRILCIFQPHTYTRTRELFEDFATVLGKADEAVLLDIYAAREPDLGLVHARDLAVRIRETGGHAMYAASFTEAADMAVNLARPGDLILTMGAGDVNGVADLLLHPPQEHPR